MTRIICHTCSTLTIIDTKNGFTDKLVLTLERKEKKQIKEMDDKPFLSLFCDCHFIHVPYRSGSNTYMYKSGGNTFMYLTGQAVTYTRTS